MVEEQDQCQFQINSDLGINLNGTEVEDSVHTFDRACEQYNSIALEKIRLEDSQVSIKTVAAVSSE